MVRLRVELFESAAAVYPLYCVESVRCLCVCSESTLLRGAVVPNPHYCGAALYSAGPALLRALSVQIFYRHYTRHRHYSTGTIEGPVL